MWIDTFVNHRPKQQQHSVAILAQDCHNIELFVCRDEVDGVLNGDDGCG